MSCPTETVLRGMTPPEGYEQWCERTTQDGGLTRHGPYRAWYPSGQPFIEADYCSGNRCGRYAEWYANGRPKSLGEFDALGRYQGRWSFWTEGGATVEQDFVDGQLVASSSLDVLDAGVAAAPPPPTPAATTVVVAPSAPEPGTGGSAPPTAWAASPRSVPMGVAFESSAYVPAEASMPVVCPPGAIPGGQPFPQGLVQWCHRRDRYGRWVRHGILREWYPNGVKRSESDYVNGRPTGWVTRWYPNGQKSEETHYLNGVPDGKSTRWSPRGMLLSQETFQLGQRVGIVRGPIPPMPAPQ